eukprot:2844007-Rhodomonas_salina.1
MAFNVLSLPASSKCCHTTRYQHVVTTLSGCHYHVINAIQHVTSMLGGQYVPRQVAAVPHVISAFSARYQHVISTSFAHYRHVITTISAC